MSDVDLSRALILFLGFGRQAFPAADEAAVIDVFGAKHAAGLLEGVRAILADLRALPIEWSRHDLSSAARWARQEMRPRYPGLSEPALSALEWKFTFDWR
ncbi:MAG: hypothetical protein ACK4RV_02675 [Caulobacter sp.]